MILAEWTMSNLLIGLYQQTNFYNEIKKFFDVMRLLLVS